MIKKGASIDSCNAQILRAYIAIIQPLYKEYGQEAAITSGSEAYEHSAKRSAHYRGDALDLRSKVFTVEQKHAILEKLSNQLGPDFVIILEGLGKVYEHFHIHWSPVYHGS